MLFVPYRFIYRRVVASCIDHAKGSFRTQTRVRETIESRCIPWEITNIQAGSIREIFDAVPRNGEGSKPAILENSGMINVRSASQGGRRNNRGTER